MKQKKGKPVLLQGCRWDAKICGTIGRVLYKQNLEKDGVSKGAGQGNERSSLDGFDKDVDKVT